MWVNSGISCALSSRDPGREGGRRIDRKAAFLLPRRFRFAQDHVLPQTFDDRASPFGPPFGLFPRQPLRIDVTHRDRPIGLVRVGERGGGLLPGIGVPRATDRAHAHHVLLVLQRHAISRRIAQAIGVVHVPVVDVSQAEQMPHLVKMGPELGRRLRNQVFRVDVLLRVELRVGAKDLVVGHPHHRDGIVGRPALRESVSSSRQYKLQR